MTGEEGKSYQERAREQWSQTFASLGKALECSYGAWHFVADKEQWRDEEQTRLRAVITFAEKGLAEWEERRQA